MYYVKAGSVKPRLGPRWTQKRGKYCRRGIWKVSLQKLGILGGGGGSSLVESHYLIGV